jgi:hypothetical protein
MNLDELLKYILWAALFGGGLYGIYRLMHGLGVA